MIIFSLISSYSGISCSFISSTYSLTLRLFPNNWFLYLPIITLLFSLVDKKVLFSVLRVFLLISLFFMLFSANTPSLILELILLLLLLSSLLSLLYISEPVLFFLSSSFSFSLFKSMNFCFFNTYFSYPPNTLIFPPSPLLLIDSPVSSSSGIGAIPSLDGLPFFLSLS